MLLQPGGLLLLVRYPHRLFLDKMLGSCWGAGCSGRGRAVEKDATHQVRSLRGDPSDFRLCPQDTSEQILTLHLRCRPCQQIPQLTLLLPQCSARTSGQLGLRLPNSAWGRGAHEHAHTDSDTHSHMRVLSLPFSDWVLSPVWAVVMGKENPWALHSC